MTPSRQGPLSVGPGGLALVLALCACFLTVGFAPGATEGVATVPGAGWACAQAGATRHDRTAATANDRTMKKLRERQESPKRLGEGKTGYCGNRKLERVRASARFFLRRFRLASIDRFSS